MEVGHGEVVSSSLGVVPPFPLRQIIAADVWGVPFRFVFNFWVSNCIFLCILRAIMSATLQLPLDILHTRAQDCEFICWYD